MDNYSPMDRCYYKSTVFDLTNKSEIKYYNIIPTIDYLIFKKLLVDNIKIINNKILKDIEFMRFKRYLESYEIEWNVNIFKWIKFKSTMKLIICWNNLENKTNRYFQVLLALQYAGEEYYDLVDIWKDIDNFL